MSLTPEGDEDGVEDGAGVVEEIGYPGVEADVAEVPEGAAKPLVAQRTHDELTAGLTDLIGWRVPVDGDDSVHEHHQPHHRSRKQPARVHPWERHGRDKVRR